MKSKIEGPGGIRHMDFVGDYYLGLKYTKGDFTKEELNYLRKKGKWLSALVQKITPAASESARHFVEVFTNGAEPINEAERLWKRYLFALEEEQELRQQRIEQAKESEAYKRLESRLNAP